MNPGLGAELWRGLAVAGARQGDVATTAELGRGTASFGSGCAGRGKVRHREGSRGQIKGEAVILGLRDTAESPRDLREELLRAGTTEKKGVTGGPGLAVTGWQR